jgi:hypothetical protein
LTLTLFSSDPISFPSTILTAIAWHAEFWFTYREGSGATTQFLLSYTGSNTPTIQKTTYVVDPTLPIDLKVFVRWSVESTSNAITCDVLSIVKIF